MSGVLIMPNTVCIVWVCLSEAVESDCCNSTKLRVPEVSSAPLETRSFMKMIIASIDTEQIQFVLFLWHMMKANINLMAGICDNNKTITQK